jgi:polar amino acid transport system substrate-binding protein
MILTLASALGRPLLTAAIALLAAQAGAAECVKTVRWSDDAPYSFAAPNGEVHGFNADLAREAFARIGCGARFVEMPWARALVELEAGRLDVLPGALRKPEREKFAFFSRPVNRSPNVLFIRKAAEAKYPFQKLGDLIGTDFRLGAQIGVTYGGDFETLAKRPEFNVRITQLTARKSAWKMMEIGRLDGVIADEVTALAELQQLGLSSEIVKSGVVVATEPAAFALSKQSNTADFVRSFDHSLESMLKDGKYKEIRERYVPCTTSIVTLGCK